MIMRLKRRAFVAKLNFLTSPGHLDGIGSRDRLGLSGNGPKLVITDRALFRFEIDPDNCVQCGECEQGCPVDAISVDEDSGIDLKINSDLCTRCGLCEEMCPSDAISRVPGIDHG